MDSHCHLQHPHFDADRDAVLARAVAAGIERILVPGWDLPSSEAALALAAHHSPLVQAAVGIHPHDASTTAAGEASWERLESLVADPQCVAVGEIGLDFYRNLSPPDAQRAAFTRQLELASRLGKPVLVHDRDAHPEITAALLAWRGRADRPARGVLHAFSGDAAMAAALAAAGFLISFALPLSFRRAVGPREAAVALPSAAILVETDAPFLGPDPRRRNEPTNALRVAAELARMRGTEPQAIATTVRASYEQLTAR